jgi:hypothetical protein
MFMRSRSLVAASIATTVVLLGLPDLAQAFQTLSGTLGSLVVSSTATNGPETISFKLNLPAGVAQPATGCPVSGNGFFLFSPGSVPDAQTRKNLIATLFSAQASGSTLVVIYDNTGKFCDPSGYAYPIALELVSG